MATSYDQYDRDALLQLLNQRDYRSLPTMAERTGAGQMAGAGTNAYSTTDDLLGQYGRRNEGAGGVGRGVMSGAATGATIGSVVPGLGTIAGGVIGGIAGGIGGALTKNAKTAMTDFAVNDARDAIAKQYRNVLGREASPDEINSQLSGQGFNAGRGDRWVGEDGLRAVLDSIANSDEARGVRPGVNNPLQSSASGTGATQTATPAGQFTGGSGALVDPYTLPEESALGRFGNAQRYTGYDASTGRTGLAGAATGAGGYNYAGFDFGQDPGNRDIGKSAKYAFSYLSEQAAAAGVPQPRTKAEAEAWFTQHIAPGLNELGYAVEWVQGDKARLRTREGVDTIDFVIGADGENPTIGWQSEELAPGPGAGRTVGSRLGLGAGLPNITDLTSSDLMEQLMQQLQAAASGQGVGPLPYDREALLRLLVA